VAAAELGYQNMIDCSLSMKNRWHIDVMIFFLTWTNMRLIFELLN
jgi:hypothetical protein